jgi:succinate dehydrogenase / fumarate reductase cytochrome b subunit
MADNRPLSPHIQVYRWQWTMLLSILHRATGIALSVGTLLLALWLISLAMGPLSFARAQLILGSGPGLILLAGWSFALFYHLLNGLRHLAWDAGWGFELKSAYASGMIAVGGAVILTVLVWIGALSVYGGF